MLPIAIELLNPLRSGIRIAESLLQNHANSRNVEVGSNPVRVASVCAPRPGHGCMTVLH